MKSHLDLAKALWKNHLKKGDCVVDATLGNGHDLLFLAKILFPSKKGLLYGIDIQEKALQNSKTLLASEKIYSTQIFFLKTSHEDFSFLSKRPHLIVYNLGYLPGSDKMVTTRAITTIKSLKKALHLLRAKGALSIMLYPGHEEGEREKEEVLFLVKSLPHFFSVTHCKSLQKPKAPSLLWIVKKEDKVLP